MFRYKSTVQPEIGEFKSPSGTSLRADNRWVKLASVLPWGDLAEIYGRSLHPNHGAPSVDARVVIGAMLIKHKLKLDDRGTIEMIQENPYMQYFLGFDAFRPEAVFDASLFVAIRKRLGAEAFDEMSGELVKRARDMERRDQGDQGAKEPPASDPLIPPIEGSAESEGQTILESQPPAVRKGILKVDATVCDQYINYPTDLNLTARARAESERLLDILCKLLSVKVKPRTYRQKARQQYLSAAKNKKLSKRKRHTAIGQQLRYLRRNLGHLDRLLDHFAHIPFGRSDYKIFLVIQHVYAQQEQMWRSGTRRCDDRIVSIHQPHVRPIVRGKSGKNVEFGPKITVSLVDGFARIDLLSWNAFNEGQVLIQQINAYEAEYGYLPEKVAADNIYGTRENRQWCKEQGIHLQVKPLGRPPAQKKYPNSQKKKKNGLLHRNDMEGKFGEGKNGFNLNKIRAKLQKTSESWIAAIFFVMNANEILRRATALPWLAIAYMVQKLVFYRRKAEILIPVMLITLERNQNRSKINQIGWKGEPFSLAQ